MKWIVILLVVGGIAYGVIFHKEELMGLLGKKTGTEETGAPNDPAKRPSDSGTPGKVDTVTKPEPKPQPKKEEIDPDIIAEFPMPEFKTIEEITGNWESVPPSAFPRTVNLLKDVEMIIAGGAGRSTIPAGQQVNALALTGKELAFSRSVGSSLRSSTDVDNTDFKTVLTDVYEAWKKRKLNKVLQDRKVAMRDRKTEVAVETGVVAVAGDTTNIDPIVGEKPEQQSDGKVPVMVASIQRKDVNEIKIDEIDGWGPVRYEMVDGKPFWTGTVRYTTSTLFGEIDTEAMALIRKNKVMGWVYTGSGEDVP